MSFMLSLASGEYMGKDTGVESKLLDALFATLIHFGQPRVYQSMVSRNGIRNEGLTNRYAPQFAVRKPAEHATTIDSDDEAEGEEHAEVASVRASPRPSPALAGVVDLASRSRRR